MPGYYKMPEATAQAVDEEGWLHTGDLAVMDESGDCRITGRSKDMIIRGGENIYPREVEEFLHTHPKIKDVQVVGVPSSRWGEEVAAFIQLKADEEVGEEEIRHYCVDQISYYKVPSLFFFGGGLPDNRQRQDPEIQAERAGHQGAGTGARRPGRDGLTFALAPFQVSRFRWDGESGTSRACLTQ